MWLKFYNAHEFLCWLRRFYALFSGGVVGVVDADVDMDMTAIELVLVVARAAGDRNGWWLRRSLCVFVRCYRVGV